MSYLCLKKKVHSYNKKIANSQRGWRIKVAQVWLFNFQGLCTNTPQPIYLPESEYTSTKSPATMEKSEFSDKLWGSTSGNLTGRVWSEAFLLLLNWWIQGYRVRAFTFSHLNGAKRYIITILIILSTHYLSGTHVHTQRDCILDILGLLSWFLYNMYDLVTVICLMCIEMLSLIFAIAF